MLLYREDKYKKTSDNNNVAEIIIAKHRNGATGSMKLYFEDRCASFRNLATANVTSTFNTPDENLDYNSFVPPEIPEKEKNESEYIPSPDETEEEAEIEFSDN
jgi:hypothetical protein